MRSYPFTSYLFGVHYPILLCVGLLLVVCLLVTLSQRLRVPYPILLVLGGLAISMLPGLPKVQIAPDIIFLVFLPALLYEAAWFTSWKDFWKWRRIIGFLAFGLVLLTATSVAVVSSAIIPGFSLALGFLLGGIVSPPDAVAAATVMRTMAVPRRLRAVLEGESLVNDASSLIVLRFALATVLSGTFVWQEAVTSFIMVAGLGVAVGLGVAMVFYFIHRWLPTSPSTHTVLTLATPYCMYLLAESAHGSGVLAVVSGGLFLSYHSLHLFSPANRRQGLSTWTTVAFVLNGAVFMLIGLELPVILTELGDYSKLQAISYGLLIAGVVVITRMVFTMLASPFTTWMSHFITVSDAAPGWRGPLVVGYAGMRGVVSLAAALSIPLLDNNGHPFPQRNLLLFITFVVILVTLVGQGLTLPMLIRWVGIEDRDQLPAEHEQRLAARHHLTTLALRYLQQAPRRNVPNRLLAALQSTLQHELQLTAHQLNQPTTPLLAEEVREFSRIYTGLLHAQRQELQQMRRQERYDEEVVRQMEAQLDAAAERLELLVADSPLLTPSSRAAPVAHS
jgi:Na+/H+ antiporter